MSAPGTERLRLVTWNASPGRLDEKLAALAALRPDIAVLQEINRPKEAIEGLNWAGRATGGKGVALWLRSGLRATRIPRPRSPFWSIPAYKIAPLGVTLLNVWTREEHQYIAGLHGALDRHFPRARPRQLVIAGDFNGNPIFRSDGTRRDFRTMVTRLEERFRLQSAYHVATGDPFGDERTPTYYFQWDRRKPYHLDYCFVPRTWTIREVEVGTFRRWRGLSDHVPIVVDVEMPARA